MLRGKVRQARGGMKAEWGRLTHNDRRQLDGKIDQMLGLFEERYGYTRERAADALGHYLGHRAKTPRLATNPFTGRWMIFTLAGLASAVVIGWFTLAKARFGTQPAAAPPEADEPLDAPEELAEFDAVVMGYEAALD
jgi:uncharacterized protein YjbJ (UPF0337 family)